MKANLSPHVCVLLCFSKSEILLTLFNPVAQTVIDDDDGGDDDHEDDDFSEELFEYCEIQNKTDLV